MTQNPPQWSEFRKLAEAFLIHLTLEVSVVSVLDVCLRNTAASMILGVSLVEVCQYLWRRRR